mmetsp:Transcript_40677/g.75693  ORF Transcript_40677/g.75693 Transcript_40677/m.75693 type:complete len:117 (-) Transcript_40677:106-456(-)
MAGMHRARLLPLVLGAIALLHWSAAFLPAPSTGVHRQLRAAEAATVSAGLTLAGAAPALATWSEGSEPGQNIDPDSTEAYNRKILNATAICLTFAVFFIGLVISQARKLVENRWLN